MKRGALLRRLAALVFIGAAIWFLARTIQRNWHELSAHDWSVRPGLLIVSTLGLTAVLAWGVWIWSMVLRHFPHPPIPLAALQRVWFLSNLARYIPGKIWQFVGAVQLAKGTGLPPALLLTSMLVHVGFSVASAAVVGAAALPFLPFLERGVAVALAGATAVAAALLVHPAVFNFALRLVPRALHKDVVAWSGRWRDGLTLLALSIVSWIFYGAVFYLFVDAIVGIEASALAGLTGVNALAFLAGYFGFVAPAGIGFREAAMTVLLGPLASAGLGAVIAILSRLWIIAAELLGAALFLRRRSAGSSLPD